jgi:hypothetical protein
MTPPPPHPALAARRARVRRLRARVAGGATAVFLALFSGLYVQMATGHDPALGAKSAQVATTSTTTTTDGSSQQDTAPMTTTAS